VGVVLGEDLPEDLLGELHVDERVLGELSGLASELVLLARLAFELREAAERRDAIAFAARTTTERLERAHELDVLRIGREGTRERLFGAALVVHAIALPGAEACPKLRDAGAAGVRALG